MSCPDNDNSPKLPEAEQNDERNEDSTDTLIGRTLKIATKYQALLLWYLLSVAATVCGLGYLGYNKQVLDGWAIAVGVLLTFLPLLATFFGLTLPAWRKKRREARLRQWSIEGREMRPGYFRIGPYEDNEKDRQDYERADNAHEEAFRWIEEMTDPLLFLTGASGAGKSSLLNAYVIPRLRERSPQTRVIMLRCFDDPLATLRERLLTPGNIWQKPPKVDEKAVLVDLLRDACEYLDKKGERLLLIFDQFEELLILHESSFNHDPKGIAREDANSTSLSDLPNHTETSPFDARPAGSPLNDVVESVKQFLHTVKEQTPRGLCMMLSLRSDYEGMLSRLELPPLEQGRNWFKVSPFTGWAARNFLAGGFEKVGPPLLDCVMREAAMVEEAQGLVRPITLNMLGNVLNRISGELSSKEQRGGLLATDLRRTLDNHELRDHARQVLTPLLSDSGTKCPQSVCQLHAKTNLEPHTIEGCLLCLHSRGLVRRLNRAESLSDRVWEISHDFVARLLVMIMNVQHRSVWQRLRLIALPTSIIVWLLVFAVFLPVYIRGIPHPAAEQLRKEYGAKVTPPVRERGWCVTMGPDFQLDTLDQIGSLLRDINVERLDLSNCDALTNVDGLQGLTSLQSIDLSDCSVLSNVDGLQGLTGLQKLDLTKCIALTNLDGLQGLTGLQKLNLTKCIALSNLDGLRGLTGLQSLNLWGCEGLTNVDGLQGLTGLQSITLCDCHELTNLDGLQGLTGLQSLNLVSCKALTNLDGLQGLTSLQSVTLHFGEALTNVDGLQGLTGLRSLTLCFCHSLTNVDGLQGLTGLRSLDLRFCKALTNVDELQGLKELRSLDLGLCEALTNVDGLQGLRKLETLDLRGCPKLTNLKSLYELKSLRRIGLNGSYETISAEQMQTLRQALPEVIIVTESNVKL